MSFYLIGLASTVIVLSSAIAAGAARRTLSTLLRLLLLLLFELQTCLTPIARCNQVSQLHALGMRCTYYMYL